MINNILIISLSVSLVVIILLLAIPVLNKRYSLKMRYLVWLILAVRLLIPFRFEMEKAPIRLYVPVDKTVYYNTYENADMNKGEAEIQEKEENVPQVVGEYITKEENKKITLSQIIYAVWIIGAVVHFMYYVIDYLVFLERIKRCCVRFEGGDKVGIFKCRRIGAPVMIGFFKPRIILPDIEYSPEETDIIIKHELTHYKRGDIWYKLVLVIANSLHWFNPIIYLMVKQANTDLEYSCDDIVVKNASVDYKKAYSMAILKFMRRE